MGTADPHLNTFGKNDFCIQRQLRSYKIVNQKNNWLKTLLVCIMVRVLKFAFLTNQIPFRWQLLIWSSHQINHRWPSLLIGWHSADSHQSLALHQRFRGFWDRSHLQTALYLHKKKEEYRVKYHYFPYTEQGLSLISILGDHLSSSDTLQGISPVQPPLWQWYKIGIILHSNRQICTPQSLIIYQYDLPSYQYFAIAYRNWTKRVEFSSFKH